MTAAKRFWKTATVEEAGTGFSIHLDGRAVKTPAGQALIVPKPGLATTIRDEWDAQQETIDPAAMPMFSFSVTSIDRVTPQRDAVVDEISGFGGSDLVCYREGDDPHLASRQHETWQPLLDWFMASHGISLTVTDGIMPVTQPAEARAAMRASVDAHDDFNLAGLHTLVTVSGSLVIGLAVASGYLSADSGGKAALLDDLWQQEKWGYDAEADARIKAHLSLVAEASRFIAMVNSD